MEEQKEEKIKEVQAEQVSGVAKTNAEDIAFEKPIMRKFPTSNKNTLVLVVVSFLVVLVGIGTGWLLSGGVKAKKGTSVTDVAPGGMKSLTEAGLSDEDQFPDTTEGVLEEGGIEGEGTHHLVREGGASQYVYVTSTAFNLDDFAGKKVQVWGETLAGKHAGWLMDVGKIKTIE